MLGLRRVPRRDRRPALPSPANTAPANTAPAKPAPAKPKHVGVVMDGNRRWARAASLANPSQGHRHGADHIEELLGWCTDRGIDHLSVYVLSADNIRKRSAAEISYLFGLIAEVVPDVVQRSERWTLHVSGDLDLLPRASAEALRDAIRATAGRPAHLTLAIGYDGHGDILEGIRAALRSGDLTASEASIDAITAHLAGGPTKEIDLVIRTSGESRLSGFFPWQTAHAEIYLSPKMWPDFAEADFDAALLRYATARERLAGR